MFVRIRSIPWFGILLLAVPGATILGCGSHSPSRPSSGAPAPAEVTIVHSERKSLRKVVEQPGTVQAYEETHLHAKLAGHVSKLNADIGQKVKGPQFDQTGKETEPGEVLA